MTDSPDPAADARSAPHDAAHPRVAVVIPCYRVKAHVLDVIARIGDWADAIYCVDDACPERSGAFVRERCEDPRVVVVERDENGGVGAATMTGYASAIADGYDVLVKIDGDGQMDPRYGPDLVRPIVDGEADYTKGNRFFSMETVSAMPSLRLVGNAGLSFMSKLSTGYWDLFDPTNGYTALNAKVAAELPFHKIHNRYFFESDLLFRLSILRARVVELPQMAVYADEESNLSELQALLTFPGLHLRNFLKRLGYNYFLRNFSTASLTLCAGVLLTLFGLLFGIRAWIGGAQTDTAATAGTVMLAALPIILGLQFLLNFLSYDMSNVPREPIHRRLSSIRPLGAEGRPLPRPVERREKPRDEGTTAVVRAVELATVFVGGWAIVSWIAVYSGLTTGALFWSTPLVAALAGWWWWRSRAADESDPPGEEPTDGADETEEPAEPASSSLTLPTLAAVAAGAAITGWYATQSGRTAWLTAWAIGVAYLLATWRALPGPIRFRPRLRASRLDLIALGVAGLIGLVLSHYLAIGNWDDAYYFNAVVTAYQRPDLPVLAFDGMYGEEGLPIQQLIHRPQTYEVFVALICRLTGVSPEFGYYALVPMVFGFLCVVPHWLIYKAVHPRAAWLATLFTVAVLFVWGGSKMSFGNFAYSRMFQGKGVFVSVFVPLVVWAAIRYGQRPDRKRLTLLAAAQAGAAMTTSSALIVVPLASGLVLLASFGFSRRTWRSFAKGLLTSAPLIVILLIVRWELATRGELTTTGVTHPWTINLGFAWRSVAALVAFLGLPLVLAADRRGSARWAHRYVLVCFVLIFNTQLTPLLDEHVAKVFSWRTYWAVPMPAIIALTFATSVYALGQAARRASFVRAAIGAGGLAVAAWFWNGGPTTYNPRQSVGFDVPKGGREVWKIAKHVGEIARPDSLVLAPEGVSSRIAGLLERPRLVAVRRFYLKNMTRAWGEEETATRQKLLDLVKGRLDKAEWDWALDEIDRRCVDIVVFSPGGKKQGLQPHLRKRHFERVEHKIFMRTDEAHQACLEGWLDQFGP